jgi:hypothetical protein
MATINMVVLRRKDGIEVPTTWGLDCDEMGDFPGDAAAAEEGLRRARERYPGMDFRVVPYARVESHAGTEVPQSIDEVLVGTLYGELWFFRQHAAPVDETTVRLQWERKTGAGWLSSAPPDAWVELPEVPK